MSFFVFSDDLPQVGTEEVVTKFLWFPKTINGVTHWLSTRTYKRKVDLVYSEYGYHFEQSWIDLEWLEDING